MTDDRQVGQLRDKTRLLKRFDGWKEVDGRSNLGHAVRRTLLHQIYLTKYEFANLGPLPAVYDAHNVMNKRCQWA